MIAVSAKKIELDEIRSNWDSSYALCKDEFAQITKEYKDVIKNA